MCECGQLLRRLRGRPKGRSTYENRLVEYHGRRAQWQREDAEWVRTHRQHDIVEQRWNSEHGSAYWRLVASSRRWRLTGWLWLLAGPLL